MYREFENELAKWAISTMRKPLVLNGARQVGKTFTIRKFGGQFPNYIEINFELTPHLKQIFNQGQDFSAARVLRDISLALNREIVPGQTLLFFDEIQYVPEVLTALRYLYEQMPDLHVIAAGSLLNFAIKKVGLPVGRVELMYMYPMSWLEFLHACGDEQVIKEILEHDVNVAMSDFAHQHILQLLKMYLAIGGMPAVVKCWANTKDIKACQQIHLEIINAYRQDFGKYARTHQIKYVEVIFDRAVAQLGKKFIFERLSTEYRKRELAPALDLLEDACVIHKVWHSSGQAIPLGAEISFEKYKVILLDVGLSQTLLHLDLSDWILSDNKIFANKGAIAEAFVGQELLAYTDPHLQPKLFYWLREAENKGSSAEIDYLIQLNGQVVPVEVKSEKGGALKSMRIFLESHKQSTFGLRFSTHNYSIHDCIHSYPLYAIAAINYLK